MVTWIDTMSLLWAPKNPNKDSVPQTETAETKAVAISLFKTEQPKDKKLDAQGNVPLVSNPQKSENMGLGIEKNTQKPEAEKTPAAKEETKETKKTGESIDERLTRYYSKYKNATEEEKKVYLEKYITKHYETLKDRPRSEQIKIQLADFKKLLSNTKDGNDYEMLAEKINILENENQVNAAKAAITEQASSELRARGAIGVAKTAHKCDSENHLELTQLVVDSKNETAIKIGASNSSKLADENQTKAVEIYQTAEIKDEAKKEVDRILIDQYAEFAKENQVDIHKIMSASKFSETVEYAASNIWKFDKENQAPAVQVTSDTGNEKAIIAAAKQYAKYDKSAQGQIEQIIYSTGYLNAQIALLEAKTAAAEAEAKTESSTAAKTEKATISEQIKNSSSKASIESIIKKASDVDKISLLSSLSPNELVRVLSCILASNPSSSVISKVISLLPNIDPKNREIFLGKINDICSSEVVFSQIGFFDASSQMVLAKQGLKNGKSRLINENMLSNPVKAEYKQLLKENNVSSYE